MFQTYISQILGLYTDEPCLIGVVSGLSYHFPLNVTLSISFGHNLQFPLFASALPQSHTQSSQHIIFSLILVLNTHHILFFTGIFGASLDLTSEVVQLFLFNCDDRIKSSPQHAIMSICMIIEYKLNLCVE